jgi:cell division septal protein FtsQ
MSIALDGFPFASLRGVFIFGGGMAGGALAGNAMAAASAGGGLASAGGGLAGAGRVLDFRRRGAPPRRRRRSPLLALVRPLGIAAVTVALPLALGLWLLTAREFQLRTIVIGGAATLPGAPVPAAQARPSSPKPAWVRQALAPLLGRNLLRLPLAEVRLRLAANPWIAAAEVAKELPDSLRVTVTERRPAVLLRVGEVLLYADAAGRPIAPVGSPAAAAEVRKQGLLVVSLPPPAKPLPGPPMLAPPPAPADPASSPPEVAGVGDGMTAAARAGVAGALRLASQLRLLRPGWTPSLSQIDVVDEDDFQLHVAGLPCPLLVRGNRLADNLIHFDQLLPELRRRYPALAAVDLRYSRRIVVQPAPAPKAATVAAGRSPAPPSTPAPPAPAGSRSSETL